ncbi:MAG: histidine kinase [Thiobacillus sp.]|nr:histidine kinase [Thiobacillus sp.]
MRLLLGLVLMLALLAGAHAEAVRTLDRADFVFDDSPQPPPDSAAWQPVALPDQWRASRPEAAGERGWYRIHFAVSARHDPLQAVYLAKLIMNAQVWLNGVAIGGGGRFEEPVARNWNRPLLFLVPPGLLRAGDNVLYIRLRGHAYTQAALHPVMVGPEAALRERYERAYFLNITVNQTATLLIAAIGVLALSLWLRRRRDTAYAYFGVSALVWAAQSSNLYLRDVPLPTADWEILVNAGFQVFSGFLLISLLRFVSAGGRRLVGALWAGVVLAPASLWLAPPAYYLGLTAAWHLFTLACAVATLLLLMRAGIKRGNREARWLVAAMGLVVVLAMHDWLIHSQHIWSRQAGHWPLNDIFLLHYSAPLIFLAIGLIMTGRFVRVLNEFEQLNDQLEDRVEAKQAELRASYSRMRELETEQAVAEERERIYRDLHDDVGAKLLSLVYRSATAEDADLARSALQDLRDVVSRTGADSFELEEVVADWRVECEKRLGDAGIALDWHQAGDLDALRLTRPQALDLGRILREAVSNVIRHAGAHRVTVDLERCAGQLSLTVRDDGRGCAGEHKSGRGVRNMEMRAGRLGGSLSRESPAGGGCAVAVVVPL